MPPKPTAPPAFVETFASLRSVLQRHGKRLLTMVDTANDFQLASPTMTDRSGRPLFFAAVQIKKSYVSYHLMPIYMNPTLLASVTPELKKRMQGKACFNFNSVNAAQLKDLSALTKTAADGFDNLLLPWAPPATARTATAAKTARTARKANSARKR
jgi:hypothetical protein